MVGCATLVATAAIQDEDCFVSMKQCSQPMEPYISYLESTAYLQIYDTICPYVSFIACLLTGLLLPVTCWLLKLVFTFLKLADRVACVVTKRHFSDVFRIRNFVRKAGLFISKNANIVVVYPCMKCDF